MSIIGYISLASLSVAIIGLYFVFWRRRYIDSWMYARWLIGVAGASLAVLGYDATTSSSHIGDFFGAIAVVWGALTIFWVLEVSSPTMYSSADIDAAVDEPEVAYRAAIDFLHIADQIEKGSYRNNYPFIPSVVFQLIRAFGVEHPVGERAQVVLSIIEKTRSRRSADFGYENNEELRSAIADLRVALAVDLDDVSLLSSH